MMRHAGSQLVVGASDALVNALPGAARLPVPDA
jgi:hypothetical protein